MNHEMVAIVAEVNIVDLKQKGFKLAFRKAA